MMRDSSSDKTNSYDIYHVDGSNGDIDVDTFAKWNKEDPPETTDHSLPTVDEIYVDHNHKKANNASRKNFLEIDEGGNNEVPVISRSGRSRWLTLVYVGLIVLVVVLIVGIGLAFGTKNNNNNSISGSSSTAGGQVAETGPPLDLQARYDQILAWLNTNGVSDYKDLTTEGTPQQLALEFVAKEDYALLDVPTTDLTTPEGYHFVTRYVMSVLFFATKGTTWTFDLNFLTPQSVCEWYSILQYLDQTTSFRGAGCDNTTSELIVLVLGEQNMYGTIPSELGLLTTLRHISFDLNSMYGTLPSSLQRLTNLENLLISANRFSGSIPSWIDQMASLYNLDFSFNLFQGELPSVFGKMEKLEGLALDNNLITGDINLNRVWDSTVSKGLRNLKHFYMENNQLVGTLDENFLAAMTELTYFDISDNRVGGSIPSHLFALPKLEVLDLHDNDFVALPASFQVPNDVLSLLFLQKCNFANQPIPDTISNMRNLSHLDLSQNQFTGTIPSSIGDLDGLTYLFLAQNKFTPGPIPQWLENCQNLQDLSLKTTARTGSIPSFFGDLTNLILLDLDNNNLTGEIPSSLGNLGSSLEFLLVNRNNLTTSIPTELGMLTNLKLFFVEGNNRVTGSSAFGSSFCLSDGSAMLEQPAVIAPCNLCNNFPGCCLHCCANATSECNTNLYVTDLDPIWQLGYQRVFYEFNKDEYLPKEQYNTTNNSS